MRDRVFTATEWRCRFHFTIYPGEFIWQRAAGRVRYCWWLLSRWDTIVRDTMPRLTGNFDDHPVDDHFN